MFLWGWKQDWNNKLVMMIRTVTRKGENLAGCLPQACQPVCLEGVTLLSIGKVSDIP
jgi:hypothetical protein